ncbi:MAG: RagB/SusD family nutrient uptake outer membrane protein [Saonia sp.]
MKTKIALLVIILSTLISCSNDDKPEEEITGNLEVFVISSTNEPIEGAIVTTIPETQQLTTGTTGSVTFTTIEAGEYEVSALLPAFILPSTKTVTVVAGKTTTVELSVGPDPIEPIPLDIDLLLKDCYHSLKGTNLFDATGYPFYWGTIGADVLYNNPSIFSNISNLDSYEITPNDKIIVDVWTDHYRAIRKTNIGIEAIENSDYTSEQGIDENVVLGELRFLRALLYFNLVKVYGNPVLVTTAQTNLDNPPSLVQDQLKVYELIEEDLIFAESNLTSSTPSNRASIAAAQALLGKVYLQMAGFPLSQNDKYTKALEQFKKLEGLYSLETNYADVFSLENETSDNEVIFRVDFDSNNGTGGNYGVFWGPLGVAQQDNLWLVPGFPESYFETPGEVTSPVTFPINVQDSRFFQNVATFSFENNVSKDEEEISNWRSYKFRKDVSLPINPNEESFDFPYLRYADVLLLLAEAENAINGPTALAYNAVNEVRRRAFGNTDKDLPLGLSQQQFLDVILEERRLELCYEGARKDDLIRTQQLQAVIDIFNQNNPQNSKNFQPHEYIWPIPQIEINSNPDVVQNPGY